MKMKSTKLIFVFISLILLLGVGIGQAAPPPGGGSGAIFTTTPDGGIVNENVRYDAKNFVYLDGGPPPNAPAHAAGLEEGFYVFQITDPPGKLLLSVDPARCRVVHINEFGVIDELVPPMALGAESNNWADEAPKGNGFDYSQEPCHTAEAPDPPSPAGPDDAGTDPVDVPDFFGLGRHDTNTDVDHGGMPEKAIVVQMMPYGTTPNPGGVYKAWLTPLEAYVVVKGADLDEIPQDKNGRVRPHDCPDFCANADRGFVPSNRYTKTDNFKVKEFFPAEILVRKFNDLNGNGIWDDGEQEIGVDLCVDEAGEFIDCPGGWPYDFTEPLDGGTKTQKFFTPGIHVAAFAGNYTAEEDYFLDVWTQTSSRLDGTYQNPFQKSVSVDVLAVAPGETHEIVFGNFKLVDVTACKYEDKTGDGLTDDDTPISGWTVHLTIDGEIEKTQVTGDDGCYTWTDLGPLPAGSYYDVEEDVPAGWTPTSDTSHDFESPPQSGASYTFTFTNFKNVDVEACKFRDFDGDGDADEPIEGWTVHRTESGVIVDTQLTGADGCYKWTDLGPLPDGYYDVKEDVPADWTPTSDTWHKFESPPQSGASYTFTFTNFENVDVTACKLKDADGSLATTLDQTPKGGWPVFLTVNRTVVDEQLTDEITGCYTWEDLGPLPEGGYYTDSDQTIGPLPAESFYDVGETEVPGWIALTDTFHIFESPPQSGASYSFTFINTPTQGCTPGFWQGGPDKPDPQSGGARLWDEDNDQDWVNSGGDGFNPYIHGTTFQSFFGDPANVVPDTLTMFELIDTGGGSDNWRKLARDVVAAYLNASWGMAYAYTPGEVAAKWTLASNENTFLYWHTQIDGANNAIGGCPISAGGF
jgi:hypothetical protein